MGVSREQRFTAENRCPICGGYHRLPHGRGIRCFGFMGSDGAYAHCSREELAAGLDLEDDSQTYAHKLGGLCRCGRVHREQEPTPITRKPPDPKRRIVGLYGYVGADRRLKYEAVRYEPKGFSQRRPNPQGGHTWNISGVTLIPYHLPELLAASIDIPVLMPEGEKHVDALEALGFVATTTVMGAGKSHLTDLAALAGRTAIVLPDNDDVGRDHAHKLATQLRAVGCAVKLLPLPGLKEKGDVVDWISAGGTREGLLKLIDGAEPFDADAAPPPPPPKEPPPDDRGRMVDVPPFPVHVFPPTIRAFLEDGARALGCVIDLIATPFLSYVGGALGNGYEIAIKKSFVQRAILWAVVVALSGKMKTPADTWARRPLVILQARAYEAYEVGMQEYKRAHREWKARPEDKRGDEPHKPLLSHLYTTDATFEALGPILQRSPGFTIAKDEILGWVKSCDQYRGGKGGDRQKYMESWDGKAVKVDRRTQDSIFIARPVLGVAGGIQPDVLPQLTAEASLHDGFIPRMIWSYPDTNDPVWNWDDADDTGAERVANLLEKLRTAVPPDSCKRCELHPDAKPIWAEWIDDNSRIASGTAGLASAVASKMPAQVARIALILHTLWNPEDPETMVSAERLSDAIDLGEYFRAHASRVLTHFGAVGSPETAGLPKRVIRALERANGWISRTDLHRKMGGNVNGDALSEALALLQAAGKVERQVEKKEAKTKPKELWRIIPPARTYEQYEESPAAAEDDEEVGWVA